MSGMGKIFLTCFGPPINAVASLGRLISSAAIGLIGAIKNTAKRLKVRSLGASAIIFSAPLANSTKRRPRSQAAAGIVLCHFVLLWSLHTEK